MTQVAGARSPSQRSINQLKHIVKMAESPAQPKRRILSAIALVLVCCSTWTSAASTAGQAAEPAKSAEPTGVLDPDNRAITRHKLKLVKETLSYTATAGSLTVNDNKARPAATPGV